MVAVSPLSVGSPGALAGALPALALAAVGLAADGHGRHARPEGRAERRLRAAAAGLGAFAAYALLTLASWPSWWSNWRQRIAPDLGDPLFNLYVLDWVKRQIRLGLPDLYGAPFFHPLDTPILLSDHLLGLAAQALALAPLTGGSSIAGYNLLVFLAFPLSGLTAAAVCRAAGLSRPGAFVAGAVCAFAPYHWSQLSHLQVLSYQWVPPTLWLFDRLLAAPRARTAAGFLACYLLLVTGGNYLAFMVHLPLVALLVRRAVVAPGWRKLLAPRSLAVLAPAGLVAAAVTTAIFLPYALAADDLGLVRNEDNYRAFGATFPSLLTPSAWNLHFEAARALLRPLFRHAAPGGWIAERSLFPGVVPLALAAVGLARARQRRPGGWGRREWTFAAAVAALVVLADLYTLGWWPAGLPPRLSDPGEIYTLLGGLLFVVLAAWWLQDRRRRGRDPRRPASEDGRERGLLAAGAVSLALCFPVVYEPLAHLVPGLSAMRVPTRFFPFALVAAAYLAGRGFDTLSEALASPRRRLLAGGAAMALLLVELAPRPIPWHPVPRNDPPAVTRWLATARDVDAVLQLPLAAEATGELPRMDLATLHGQPLVNGFSGHVPAHWRELRRICCWPVPDARVLARLRTWGVTHLVFHPRWKKRWPRREYRRWAAAVERGEIAGVARVWSDPATGDTVFRIAPGGGLAAGGEGPP